MARIGKYQYEHIFIDNHSRRPHRRHPQSQIAAQDPNVKVIVNSRNFGHIRSPIHALFQAKGDAVLGIVADLQDPPPMIADLIREWENGAYCVLGIKRTSEEALPHVLGAQAVLPHRRAPLLHRDHPELHRLRPLRSQSRRARPLLRRPLPLLPRHDRRNRPAHRQAPLRPALAQVRHHQEQLVHPLRHRHARHHQPLQSPAPPGHLRRLRRRRPLLPHRPRLPRPQARLLVHFELGLAPMLIGVFFIASPSSSSSSASWASTSVPSTPRSRNAPTPSSSNASTSTRASATPKPAPSISPHRTYPPPLRPPYPPTWLTLPAHALYAPLNAQNGLRVIPEGNRFANLALDTLTNL